jgi:ferric-dicitrate binding protein FerR (iron transport regulator)/tetratricopeptide (TPR) repeat protein
VGKSSNHNQESCPSLDLVQPYLDDLLSPPKRTDFENHLTGCAECQVALEHYRQVRAVLKETAAEPLPALDHDRVYEKAVAGRQPSGWLIPAAAAVAAALLLLVLWPETVPVSTYTQTPDKTDIMDRAAQATITYVSADAQGPVQAAGRLSLPENTETWTGESGAIAMRVTDDISVVLLHDGRAVLLHPGDGSRRVRLTQGVLVARLRHPLDERFIVETPAGSIEATGTTFVVRILEDLKTEVWLLEGKIRIYPRQGISHEREAEVFTLFSKDDLEKIGKDISEGWMILAEAQRFDPFKKSQPLGWMFLESNPSGAEVVLGDVVLGRTPLMIAQPAGSSDLLISAAGYEPVTRPVEIRVGRVSSYQVELVPTETPLGDPLGRIRRLLAARRIEQAVLELEAYLKAKPGDVKATFLLADARRLGGKPQEALVLYRKVSDSAWDHRMREAALYEVGRLQLRALDQPAKALETFLRLKGEYPRGLLGQEVDYHLAESYIATKRFSEAVRALEDYLKHYPQGTKAQEARTLLDALKTKGWR